MTFDTRGLRIDGKISIIGINHDKIIFDVDNKQFVKGKEEVKYHIVIRGDEEAGEFLKELSVMNTVKHPWIIADKISQDNNMLFKVFYNENLKYFNVNKREIPFNKKNLNNTMVNIVLSASTFTNQYGAFQTLTLKQMRFLPEEENPTLASCECLI